MSELEWIKWGQQFGWRLDYLTADTGARFTVKGCSQYVSLDMKEAIDSALSAMRAERDEAVAELEASETECEQLEEIEARAIKAETERDAAVAQTTWQPIKTAPKDGSAFLAFGIHNSSPKDAQRGVVAGDHWWSIILWDIWRDGRDNGFGPYKARWVFSKDGKPTWSEPTHWMPLPAPPQSTES